MGAVLVHIKVYNKVHNKVHNERYIMKVHYEICIVNNIPQSLLPTKNWSSDSVEVKFLWFSASGWFRWSSDSVESKVLSFQR